MVKRKALSLVLGVFAASLLLTVPSARADAQSPAMPERGLCAHRGDQKIGPENTVPASVMPTWSG